jgi:hypothetical protein
LKYGSAEEDPDPVTGLIKVRNEPYILGQNTIQVFQNVGGNGFPVRQRTRSDDPGRLRRGDGQVPVLRQLRFLRLGRNEALGIYIAGNGTANRISTRAIDDELAKVADPSKIILESRTYREERRLFVHLPDKSLVFQFNATKELGQEVWYVAQSGVGNPYRIRNAVSVYGGFYVGDTQSSAVGKLSDEVGRTSAK